MIINVVAAVIRDEEGRILITQRNLKKAQGGLWEFPGGKGWLAVRWGEWKGLVMNVHQGNSEMELFNLQTDSLETTNVAAEHPEIVSKMWEFIKESHQPVPNDVRRYKMDVTYPAK